MERAASIPFKIAVFCSGHSRGSNLAALRNYFVNESAGQAVLALAVFTQSGSPAVSLAQELFIPFKIVAARDLPAFEAQALTLCQENNISLIALAGFMKQLSAGFIDAVRIPILNIHPALLPEYGGKGMFGMAVHKAVSEAGDKVSGATVHLVDPQYDKGLIIDTRKVNISACKSPEEIAALVLKAEHELYAPTLVNYLKSNSGL